MEERQNEMIRSFHRFCLEISPGKGINLTGRKGISRG
jgi:hypothetical protein